MARALPFHLHPLVFATARRNDTGSQEWQGAPGMASGPNNGREPQKPRDPSNGNRPSNGKRAQGLQVRGARILNSRGKACKGSEEWLGRRNCRKSKKCQRAPETAGNPKNGRESQERQGGSGNDRESQEWQGVAGLAIVTVMAGIPGMASGGPTYGRVCQKWKRVPGMERESEEWENGRGIKNGSQ